MTKRVLLICYYFPPLGLAGVGRPRHLFKRLPLLGWQCDVLTVKPVAYRAYETELLEDLDLNRVYRSGSYDPQRLMYLTGIRHVGSSTVSRTQRLSGRFFPDSKSGWVKPAVRLGRRLARRKQYHVLVSTSPPISAHLVARLLAQEHGVPWVADFRDFWTIYRVEDTYRDQRMVTRGKRLLAAIVEQASEVTVVNDAIADYLGRGEVITNGYDSDLAIRWKDPPQGERFTIGLPGHQHETREVRPLLRLLAMLRDQHPAQFEKVCLLQVGQIDARWFRRLLGEHGLQTPVSIRSQQKRRDTIRILSACHLFYLGISEREGPGFLPGRTFELIASGRPIVSYTQPGSQLARLLEGTGRVFCFQDDNIANAVEYLRGQIVAFEDGSYTYAPLSEYALQFSDHVLAKKFASVFERLL